MTVAFQVHNGPNSSDAKSDICQSDTVARKGSCARWAFITGSINFLGIPEVESVWVLAANKFVWLLVGHRADEVPSSSSTRLSQGVIVTACVQGKGSPSGDGDAPRSLRTWNVNKNIA